MRLARPASARDTLQGVKILVIGSGGREHAIAWKLAQEGHNVYGAPGNPGIAEVGDVLPTMDYVAAAREVHPDLTVVGPEVPLVEGIVDLFLEHKRLIVGPNHYAARLEGSKIHSKEFMRDAGIPTARFVHAESNEDAIKALDGFSFPVVIKADGLAAGKGVIIAHDRKDAENAIFFLGPKLVIEEYLDGEEVSFIALCDGKHAIPLEPVQDHKRIGDGDTGPNTGGMGAYCDGRILTAEQSKHVMDTIILPAVAATHFTGFLYAGLMMTAEGPKLLEFNVRLGDPEAQPLMHRLESPLAEVLMASAEGKLEGVKLEWSKDPSVCVVLAAHGYPGKPRTGDRIEGVETCGATVFQAGTKMTDQGLETAGGRVLGVTASGRDLRHAIENAYAAVGKIRFEGMQYRHDIGQKGLKRW